MIDVRPGSAGKVIVTFLYPSDSYAETVHLVGDFNDWSQHSLPFDCCRSNAEYWALTLELDAGRRFEFRYLVNGETWVNEPKAHEYVTNNYGATNSVVLT